MDRTHILDELERVKMEFLDFKQSNDVRERKLKFDLETSLKELDFERKQHLEVIHMVYVIYFLKS